MPAPYHIREFTASSGNTCRLKVFAVQPSGARPVDAEWSSAASAADIDECNQWAAGEFACPVGWCKIEDDDLRERVLRSLMAGSN